MVPVLTKKRVYVVKTGTISKFVLGLYCLRGERSLLKEDYPAMGTGQKCFEASSAAFGRCTVCRIGIFGFVKVLEFGLVKKSV